MQLRTEVTMLSAMGLWYCIPPKFTRKRRIYDSTTMIPLIIHRIGAEKSVTTCICLLGLATKVCSVDLLLRALHGKKL